MELILIGIIFILIIKIINSIKLKKEINLISKNRSELINDNIKLKEKIEELEEEITLSLEERKGSQNINYHSEFILKVIEELERKKRYEKSIFSILTINIDFFEEYKKLYKNIEQIKGKLEKEIIERIRKIDFIGEGSKEESLQILLPFTNIKGSLILAKRLQNEVKKIKSDVIITLSIIITEIADENDVNKIFSKIEKKSKELLNNGGNTIVVEKN